MTAEILRGFEIFYDEFEFIEESARLQCAQLRATENKAIADE